MNINMDVDPLSTYEYPYDYNAHPNPYANVQPVKQEQPMINNAFLHHFMDTSYRNNEKQYPLPYPNQQYQEKQYTDLHAVRNINNGNVNNENSNNDVQNPAHETKEEDVKPFINPKNIKKEKGRKSSYFSEKILDKDFKFFGCSVCDISFALQGELDQHVTVHKDRITSYDLKIKNQKKRKSMKKEQKKKKKLQKDGKDVKVEGKKDNLIDIEIKPEDGYIGSEKASEFNENDVNANANNENGSTNNGNIPNVDGSTNNGNIPNVDNDSKTDVKEKIEENLEIAKAKLQTDAERNNLERIYKCFACKKQFSLSYYLKLHVRSHTDEKPYTCSVCGQSFITASKLGRHNKRMHLSVRYQCRICYRFFSKFECLTRHFDKKHPDDKLEGEPYDYNAILPYLKELEEQLKEKAEETKTKAEDLWDGWPAPIDPPYIDNGQTSDKPEEVLVPAELDQKPVEVLVEGDVAHVVIKKEAEEESYPEFAAVKDSDSLKSEREDAGDLNHFDDSFRDDDDKDDIKEDTKDDSLKDVKDDSFKNEDGNVSDDNYFPSGTWVPPTPKVEVDDKPGRRKKSDPPLKCDICNKKISTITYMRIHMRTHTGEKPFKCYICNRGFITSSKLHRHVLTHAEAWEGDDTQVKEEDEAEIKEEEGSEKSKKQKKNKKTDKKNRVKRAKAEFAAKIKGEAKKTRRWQHTCQFCHRKFLHAETLQVHKKSHEGEELVYKCHYCLEPQPDEAALIQHQTTHTGPSPYECVECGKKYRKREAMIYHKKQHSSDKMFYCEVCLKSFTAQCKLQRHLLSHNEKKFVLRYECPVCAHMFHTKYHIQMHLSTHQKEGLIQEENRNDILAMVLQNARKFPKQSDTQTNLTDILPNDDRSRICNICGEIFQHFYYLEEHLKSHGSRIALEDLNSEEEKKHICKICNKGFKLHYYLKLHSFTHTKEKPFICQQCGKGFITRGKLKRHLETHTGVKKYQCHICCKFFTRTSYLRIHVRTIHGTQDYNFRLGKEYGNGEGMDVY